MIARTLKKFSRSDDGNTAVEYGLFTALIAVTIIVQVGLMGEALEAIFEGPVAAMDMANVVVEVDGGDGGGGDGGGGDGPIDGY